MVPTRAQLSRLTRLTLHAICQQSVSNLALVTMPVDDPRQPDVCAVAYADFLNFPDCNADVRF
jgi:hypothetical protein